MWHSFQNQLCNNLFRLTTTAKAVSFQTNSKFSFYEWWRHLHYWNLFALLLRNLSNNVLCSLLNLSFCVIIPDQKCKRILGLQKEKKKTWNPPKHFLNKSIAPCIVCFGNSRIKWHKVHINLLPSFLLKDSKTSKCFDSLAHGEDRERDICRDGRIPWY